MLLVPVLLSAASLEMFDRYNLFAPLPIVLGTGALITVSYKKAKQLAVPLWLAKQTARFSIMTLLVSLTAGYAMLQRETNT